MTSPYKLKLDCFSSHRIVADFLREQAQNKKIDVLDLGCDIGFIGTLSKNHNIIITGVDFSERVLRELPKVYSSKIILDLNNREWKIDSKYDYVIFTDVAEHLIDPKEAMKKIAKILKPDGILIVSLPNIAFIWARFLLLLGIFPQDSRGLFDQTHFHHYTKSTAKAFIINAGYKIMEEKFTTPPIPESPIYYLLQLLARINPELFAYQFIFFCQKL